MSSLLIHVAKRPEPSRSPRLIAALCPPSGSLTHVASQGAYFLMMSTEPSVLPPSRRSTRDWDNPGARPSGAWPSRKRAWLNDGRHDADARPGSPSGMVGGSERGARFGPRPSCLAWRRKGKSRSAGHDMDQVSSAVRGGATAATGPGVSVRSRRFRCSIRLYRGPS